MNFIGQVSFVVFFYIFPHGRFVSRWPRWLALIVALLYIPDIFFPDAALDFLDSPIFFVFIASLVFAQVYRYARVLSPAQRQQTKWVIFGFSTALAGFLGTILLYEGVPAVEQAGLLGEMVAETVVYGFLLLIPLSIGMAILRSRLYDIDLLINRTLVYGALTAMLAAVYLGGVAATQAILQVLTSQDQQPQLAIVASTLVIADRGLLPARRSSGS